MFNIFPHSRHIWKMAHHHRTFIFVTLCVTTILVVYTCYVQNVPYKHFYSHDASLPCDEDEVKVTLPLLPQNVKAPPLPKTLPYAALLKSIREIQQASWTTQLYAYLKSLNHSVRPHVNMVFGDSRHMDVVLNWIIAAHLRLNPPLHNIMVLSIDQPLCDFLALKEVRVACIAVPPESFLASTEMLFYNRRVKSRLLVLRMINFWGYDVASYDCDAVVRHNPQHLFQSNPNVQIFGGASYTAQWFAEKFGIDRFAVCGGALMVKSHPSTGTHAAS